jgi:hypothetical protein
MKYRDEICSRLKNLQLSENVDIGWYIDRLDVLVEARTIEDVEAHLLRRLAEPVAAILGAQPLMSELEEILTRLSSLVARHARAFKKQRWSREFFSQSLCDTVTRVTGHREDGSIEPLESLANKLKPAGIPLDESRAQTDILLGYRRRYRSALGVERELFNSLNDHVFAICTDISAQRRAGMIADGPSAYAETVRAVTHLDLPHTGSIPVYDKLAALSDVTARCQNRYSDDS